MASSLSGSFAKKCFSILLNNVSSTFFGNQPPHYRVVLDNDPIPYMPPFPFLQSGIAINASTLDWEEGGERNRKPFTEIDGRDHSIREYLNVLKRHGNF